MSNEVNVPEEAVELYREAGRGASVFEDDTDPDYIDLISDAAVQAAAPAIRNQERQRVETEREAERCESCDDTGIYEEGDEWAPCEECEVGRGFLERLKIHAEETRQSEHQRIREALASDHAIKAGAERLEDILDAPYAEAIAQKVIEAAQDHTLEDPEQPAQRTANGGNGPGMDGQEQPALSEGVGSGAEGGPSESGLGIGRSSDPAPTPPVSVAPSVLAEVKNRLFADDPVDEGDGALFVRSDVNPDRMVADFRSGLTTAWDTAFGSSAPPPQAVQGETCGGSGGSGRRTEKRRAPVTEEWFDADLGPCPDCQPEKGGEG